MALLGQPSRSFRPGCCRNSASAVSLAWREFVATVWLAAGRTGGTSQTLGDPFSWGENRRLHGRRDTASSAGCYHSGVLNGDSLADGDARRTGSSTHLHLGD